MAVDPHSIKSTAAEMMVKALHDATESGNIDEVRKLLDAMPDLIHTRDEYEGTVLHWAVHANQLDLVNFLIERGVDVRAVDTFGQTALPVAAVKDPDAPDDEHGLDDLFLPESSNGGSGQSEAGQSETRTTPPGSDPADDGSSAGDNKYRAAYDAMVLDPRYLNNLDTSIVADGHPNMTVRAHIAKIERNLEALGAKFTEREHWKQKLLIHSHDTFHNDAKPGVSITNPKNHASLARDFLKEFCDSRRLLTIVQYHDEPLALWRQEQNQGRCNATRLEALLYNIRDWNMFLGFIIIDGCIDGRDREHIHWMFKQIENKLTSHITANDIF